MMSLILHDTVGMLVILFRGTRQEFLSRYKCSWQNVTIFSSESILLGALKENLFTLISAVRLDFHQSGNYANSILCSIFYRSRKAQATPRLLSFRGFIQIMGVPQPPPPPLLRDLAKNSPRWKFPTVQKLRLNKNCVQCNENIFQPCWGSYLTLWTEPHTRRNSCEGRIKTAHVIN